MLIFHKEFNKLKLLTFPIFSHFIYQTKHHFLFISLHKHLFCFKFSFHSHFYLNILFICWKKYMNVEGEKTSFDNDKSNYKSYIKCSVFFSQQFLFLFIAVVPNGYKYYALFSPEFFCQCRLVLVCF